MAARARFQFRTGSPSGTMASPTVSPTSGTRASRYVLVRECMAKYISPILVDSVLRRALALTGASSTALGPGTLESVVEESMVGLRLFVDPARLPDLMVELADILAMEDT